jgi:putative N-acetylmannosamine-6-phosphate epimerase
LSYWADTKLSVSTFADPTRNEILDKVFKMSASVLLGGAGGLRAEDVSRIAAFRAQTDLPIIGITKAYGANDDVYITRDFQSAQSISHAGADIIALNYTHRRLTQPEPWPEIIRRIHSELGRPACADIATLDDALETPLPDHWKGRFALPYFLPGILRNTCQLQ